MTFELVAAVNNKLNSFAVNVASEFNNVNREINNIYDVMGKFFRQTRSDILQLEQRVDKLERNIKLLNWQASIEYQSFDGIEYESLSTIGKIVCMTKDFYEITQGSWTTSDLLLLKSALAEVDLPPKSKITYLDFLNGLIDEPQFLAKLLDGINLENVDAVYMTLLETVKKYQLLETTEKYQVESVQEMMASQGVELPQRQIEVNMVTKYIDKVSGISFKSEVSNFEFCLELLYNFKQSIESLNQKIKTEEDIIAEELCKKGDFIRNKSLLEKLLKEGKGKFAYYLAHIAFRSIWNTKEMQIKRGEYLAEGVRLGDINCKSWYARWYKGNFSAEDYNKLYEEATQGNYVSQYELYELMYFGLNDIVDRNAYESVNWLKKSAEQGFAIAQNELGEKYLFGDTVTENHEEGEKWIIKAAESGYIEAQWRLGNTYQWFNDLNKKNQAIHWYEMAAEQGSIMSLYDIGECYEKGNIVIQNDDKALYYYHKAANKGHYGAKYQIGRYYYNVVKDYKEAFKWYMQAAESETFDKAKNTVGNMYYRGHGVEKNFEEAVKWYKIAAQEKNIDGMEFEGDAWAQYNLAGCYHFGQGVKQDYKKAYKWYKRSADQGNEKAKEELNRNEAIFNLLGVV